MAPSQTSTAAPAADVDKAFGPFEPFTATDRVRYQQEFDTEFPHLSALLEGARGRDAA